MNEFRVEFKLPSESYWALDETFESLGEAMDYATRESLVEKWHEHRIVKTTEIEVLVIPPMEGVA